MNRKTTIILVGILVMALAVVGIGYGLWFEDLVIQGRVHTGILDVGFSPWTAYEWFENAGGDVIATQEGGVPPLEVPQIAAGLFMLKDNVNCYAEFHGPDGLDNPEPGVDTGFDMMEIFVEGAYPGYACLITFDITNLGTVPVHLSEWEIIPDKEYPDASWVATPVCEKREDTPSPEGVIQLHQGEHADCYVILKFTNETIVEDTKDVVQELTTYKFHFMMQAAQWNETMPGSAAD